MSRRISTETTETILSDSFEQEINCDVHKIEIEELLKRLETDARLGLTSEKAKILLNLYGPNKLAPPKKKSKFIKLLKEMFSGISLLLNLGGAVSILSYFLSYYSDKETEKEHLYLGIILICIVVFTTIFGIFQEAKSSKIMKSFAKLMPQETLAIRNSTKVNIKSEEVVIGDIIFLKGGDLIPADVRMIKSNSMKVDNSPLTGESEPQFLSHGCSDRSFLQAENLAFAYTHVIEGTGMGVVFATGDSTVIGKIAERTSSIEPERANLTIEIQNFIHIITILAFFIGAVSFILSLTVVKDTILNSIIFLIGIIVANVPEGLLVTVTISLALTAKRMSKKNCLVKNLESVETLGSVSTICSDKTGTITQNKMTVSHLWFDGNMVTVDVTNLAASLIKEDKTQSEELLTLVACICNRAEFWENQDFNRPVWELMVNGDPTETALLKFYENFYGSSKKTRQKFKKVFENPFNSNTKVHLAIHQNLETKEYIISKKGAAERILEHCKKIHVNDQILDLNEEYTAEFNKAYEQMADYGERVLGFSSHILTEEEFKEAFPDLVPGQDIDFDSCDSTFLGLISLLDPPRPAVPSAIECCRRAGIRVIMVTGDHPLTAISIAKEVGIVTLGVKTYEDIKKDISNKTFVEPNKHAAVITGNDLYDLSSKELDFILTNYYELVFARTSPRQKLLIVEGLQRGGVIVAVTGDGVNDTPAIRKANIGISMGITGSDITKQAADLILLDDNFSSIVTGIKEGRLIFDNLKKSVAYTLTSNIPELVPFILNVLLGVPLPLGTLTILCIDMTTDLIPALSLAYENPETDIMSRKPRKPKKHRLVGWKLIRFAYLLIGVLQTLAALLSYLYLTLNNGFKWSDLLQPNKWSSRDVLYITDSYKQEWSYLSRRELEYSCYSAYFLSIVIVQTSSLLISKTRIMSIFKHGIFSNKLLLIILFSEVILSLLFVYSPFFNIFLKTRPFHPKYLFPAIFFNFFLWIADELRRLLLRRYPKCFISRETFY